MKTVEFGVMLDEPGGLVPRLVPVDQNAQAHLEKMFDQSVFVASKRKEEAFQLAEKYSPDQCAVLTLSDVLAGQIKDLYDAKNVPVDTQALDEPEKIKAYFAVITIDGGAKALGIKQATQFKTLHKRSVFAFANGQLAFEDRPLFKLDETWDLFTYGTKLTILSATALERICDLSKEIRNAAVAAVADLAPKMPYVDFAPIESRVASYTRSARIAADLRKRNDLSTVSLTSLQSESDKQKIDYEVIDGQFIIKLGSEEGFLMLLDRRRYADPLATTNPDIYEADSRHKVSKKS